MIWELHERGWSYRCLARRLGLVRASVQRWQVRLRQGLPAIGTPGPARRTPPHPALLHAQIAALQHGAKRSRGAGGLWRHWREWVSRRDFARLVAEQRRAVNRDRREARAQLLWRMPGTVWAMDGAQQAGIRWNLVCDLASRFRFEPLLGLRLTAGRVRDQLARLFDTYGPPIVLKRDRGSLLDNRAVDQLLDAYGVLSLDSPLHYPRYNGGVEYAQRELKTVAGVLVESTGEPFARAIREATAWINAIPRPCLSGASAADRFAGNAPNALRAFSQTERKEAKCWIRKRTRTILNGVPACSRYTYETAWRLATEAWMIEHGLVDVVKPKKLLPLFA